MIEISTARTGLRYERLMMQAHQLSAVNSELAADRRVYYLLHYIKIGYDLRQTGYSKQFNWIKDNIIIAMELLLKQEIHRDEKAHLRKLLKKMDNVWTESALEQVINRCYEVTRRLWELGEIV
ncbi:MAG TPA: hypothetical protein VL098_09665 [Flavipsychrobacter sp.]|nr:hypothetical protein [Flavipsychrobacter sp.]